MSVPPSTQSPPGAVFLSYASQDAEAARRICDALRATGVEVWFDQNELVGGDAWDAKIRKQIAECALFVPIISANTQARLEGYFRIEWKLAARRTHAMATAKAFLLPVVIDATRDAEAHVPDEFRDVQWTRLGAGETPPAFGAHVQKLLLGGAGDAGRPRAAVRDSDLAGAATEREHAPALKRNRARRIAPIIGGVVIAVMALVIARPWQKTASGAAQPVSATVTKSSARQLAGKALVVALDGSATIEALRSAMAIADKAVSEDPLDGEIWAISALVDLSAYESATDVSEKRRDSIRSKLARAKGLAATAPLTQYAEVKTLLRIEQTPVGLRAAEEIARRLLDKVPEELSRAQVLSMLAMVLEGQMRFAEAARVAEEAGSWRGASWAYLVAGDLPRALRMAERQTETDPAGGLFQQMTVQFARGDLDALEAAIQRLPATARLEERTLSIQLWLAYCRRDSAALATAARRFSDEYIHNTYIKQARGFFSGIAHQWAGRPDAARGDWTEALRVVEQRIAAEPKVGSLQLSRLSLLAKLGRRDEAGAALEFFRQHNQDPWVESDLTALLILLGREEEALDQLEKLLRSVPRRYWAVHTVARYADAYDSLRDRPRFEKLLRETLLPGAKTFDDPKPAVALPAPDAKSVAVLAFKNLSGDPAREFFSDGLSEAVSDVLGRVPGLKVVGSASAFSFKGKSVPIPEIARQLGVTHLVEGTVLQDGQSVRITAKLIQSDGFQVGATEKVDRELKNIFALHDEVAGLIAKNLSLKLGAGSAAATATVNPQAFELYVQARQAWNRRNPDGYVLAGELLVRALELAPRFAKAHAALADVWELQGEWDNTLGPYDQRESALAQRVTAKAKEALAWDPECAEAHASLGLISWNRWQFATGEQALRAAIQINPSYASAHQWLGRNLLLQGRLGEALAALQKAAELDPLSPRILDNYAWALRHAGRSEAALAHLDRALALQPDAVQAKSQKARILADQGRLREAAELERSVPEGVFISSHFRAIALARIGGPAAQERLRALTQDRNTVTRLTAGLGLGRGAAVLEQIEPGHIEATRADVLLFDSFYDPIRHDPRFAKFLADLNLTEAHARAQEWRKAHPPEKP